MTTREENVNKIIEEVKGKTKDRYATKSEVKKSMKSAIKVLNDDFKELAK